MLFSMVQLEGVTIAEMQSDLNGHDISVETHENINIYQSAKNLAIAGTGFRPGESVARHIRWSCVS